jgi:hypothetical protein
MPTGPWIGMYFTFPVGQLINSKVECLFLALGEFNIAERLRE